MSLSLIMFVEWHTNVADLLCCLKLQKETTCLGKFWRYCHFDVEGSLESKFGSWNSSINIL